jgi:hypothetical protein
LTADNLAVDSVTADQINVADLSAVSANMGKVVAYEANIADAAITNAKISGVIQSDNYWPGHYGWKIDKNGSAEFQSGVFDNVYIGENCDVRGTIYADKIVGDTVRVDSAFIAPTFIGEDTFPTWSWVRTVSIGLSSASFIKTLIIEGFSVTSNNCPYEIKVTSSSGAVIYYKNITVDGTEDFFITANVPSYNSSVHIYIKRNENNWYNSLGMKASPLKVTSVRANSNALNIYYVWGQ